MHRVGEGIPWTVLCVLVRSELNAHPEFRPRDRDGDLAEHCKGVAARAGIRNDPPTIAKAIDAVHASRAERVERHRAGFRPRDTHPRL